MSATQDSTVAPKSINPGFAGMDAGRRGEPVEACPYEPGPQRTAWVAGWYIARSQDRADA